MTDPDQQDFESGRSDRRPRTLISSLGGFSESTYKSIRSLQDLLRAIQPLSLPVFKGSNFEELAEAGEGAYYRVKRCVHRTSKQIAAVKRVKLPLKSSGLDAFHDRVGCVLRDIEVMSHPPLVNCSHIIDLLGYGWQLLEESVPFLVTEFAYGGNLRHFLLNRTSNLSGHERLRVCRNIAAGLEALHLAGVAHGDLKLDNVLVVREEPILVKIADFGFSLLLHYGDQNGEQQRYNGTELYNAPEVSRKAQIEWNAIDFRKCDVWAFGLLCWEIMLGGHPYYEDRLIQDLLIALTCQSSHISELSSAQKNNSAGSQAEEILRHLPEVQQCLETLIIEYVNTRLHKVVRGAWLRALLSSFFSQTIKRNPSERVGDVSSFALECGVRSTIVAPKEQLVDRVIKLSALKFDNFQAEGLTSIRHAAKEQIVLDFKHVASRSGDPDARRASFQVAISHAIGFGTEMDFEAAKNWFYESSAQGFDLGSRVFQLLQCQSFPSSSDHYLAFFRESVRRAVFHDPVPPTSLESIIKRACTMGNFDLLMSSFDTLSDQFGTSSVPSSILHVLLKWLFMYDTGQISKIVGWITQSPENTSKVLCETLDSDTQTSQALNEQLPLHLTDSPLLNAITAASLPATEALLGLGANPLKVYSLRMGISITPLNLAASLHLLPIFQRLLEHCMGIESYSRKILNAEITHTSLNAHANVENSPKRIRQSLASPFFLHRLLIHGRHTAAVMEEMVTYLLEMTGPLQMTRKPHDISSQGILEHAMNNGNLELIRTWIECSGKINGAFADGNIWSTLDKINLMIATVDFATKEIFPISRCKDMIQYAISIGCSLDAKLPGSSMLQPLHSIILRHQEELFDWMLQHNFDPNAPDPDGKTCLHHLLISGFSNLTRMTALLDLGADPNRSDNEGVTPVHLAVKYECGAELRKMLQQVKKLKADLQGNTPLHLLVDLGRDDFLPFFDSIESTSINMTNCSGETPLLVAARTGNTQVVEKLVAAGACTEVSDISGKSWLHLAASQGHIQTVRTVLKFANDKLADLLELRDKNGDIPLNSALKNFSRGRKTERRTCCHLLLEAGSNPDEALHVAIDEGSPELTSLILPFHPDPEFIHPSRHNPSIITTCLSKAAFFNNLPIVELLLKNHAPLGSDLQKRTCLHWAVIGGSTLLRSHPSLESSEYTRMLILLIVHLAEKDPSLVDAQDDAGRSALHIATLCNQRILPSFMFLFSTESKPKIKIHSNDIWGHSALHLAMITGNSRLLLVDRLLSDFIGGTASTMLKAHQSSIAAEGFNIKFACQLIRFGVDCFTPASNLECPYDLTKSEFQGSESKRTLLRALMLVHNRDKRPDVHTELKDLRDDRIRRLSEVLQNAIDFADPSGGILSASAYRLLIDNYRLHTATPGLFVRTPAIYKALAEVLHLAGESLFMSRLDDWDSLLPNAAITLVLKNYFNARAPTICLLYLHAKSVQAQPINKTSEFLNVKLGSDALDDRPEHHDTIAFTWEVAWRHEYWVLVEAFMCLGLQDSAQKSHGIPYYEPTDDNIFAFICYAIQAGRDLLLSALTGEVQDFLNLRKEAKVDMDTEFALWICRSFIREKIPEVEWLQRPRALWRQSTTFDTRIDACFGPDSPRIKKAISRSVDDDIFERFELHLKTSPQPGELYESHQYLRCLRELVEELFEILAVVQGQQRKDKISELIDRVLTLAISEGKKPRAPGCDFNDAVLPGRSDTSAGFYKAIRRSIKYKGRARGCELSTYSLGTLFYVIKGAPFDVQGKRTAKFAIRIHDKNRETVVIPTNDFVPVTSCLLWNDE